jgi:hypothetical protein
VCVIKCGKTTKRKFAQTTTSCGGYRAQQTTPCHKVSKDNLFYYFKKLFFVPFLLLLLLLVSQECRGAGAIINHSQKAQKKNRVCWGCRASKSTSQKKCFVIDR